MASLLIIMSFSFLTESGFWGQNHICHLDICDKYLQHQSCSGSEPIHPHKLAALQAWNPCNISSALANLTLWLGVKDCQSSGGSLGPAHWFAVILARTWPLWLGPIWAYLYHNVTRGQNLKIEMKEKRIKRSKTDRCVSIVTLWWCPLLLWLLWTWPVSAGRSVFKGWFSGLCLKDD